MYFGAELNGTHVKWFPLLGPFLIGPNSSTYFEAELSRAHCKCAGAEFMHFGVNHQQKINKKWEHQSTWYNQGRFSQNWQDHIASY